MRLVNIHNQKRTIYLFQRDETGQLAIEKDTSFFPYFYEPDPNGPAVAFNGTRLQRVFAGEPGDVAKMRSPQSYEADVLYPKRYVIDRVTKLDPVPIRYMFLDIEVLTRELPDYRNAKAPVSCISCYDSFTQRLVTWYMDEMPGKTQRQQEIALLEEFVKYMRDTSPDLWLSWNVDFDYNYLQARIERMAQQISPIGQVRMPLNRADKDDKHPVFYPAGISIVDYLSWFKKVHMREQSYTLDHIAQKYLGEETWGETKFSELNPQIKSKNINDINRLVKLEEQFKIIPYFDAIRRLSKCQWEDLYHNSRIIEMLLFEEAKAQGVILPNKPGESEKEDFQGATRDVGRLGVSFNVGKYDLSSAYPSMIIDFCLDNANIVAQPAPDALQVDATCFRQNPTALLPSILKKLLVLKNKLKAEVSALKYGDPGYDEARVRYDAIKAVVNSGYGVFGNRFFRLYDPRVAGATTYLVRDVLLYVKAQLEELGYQVLYYDTDSVFIDSGKNIVNLLNAIIQDWASTKYHKDDVSLEFGYEGQFEKLLILKKCRYVGYLNKGKKGAEIEIKGVEIKRGDSSKFMSKFQRELIDKILNQEPRPQIVAWIKAEIERMKTLPLDEVSFPCKIGKDEDDYKTTPIFMRALEYAAKISPIDKVRGELFWYVYIHPKDYDTEPKTEYYLEEKTSRTLKSGAIKEGTRKVAVTKTKYAAMTDVERKAVLTRTVDVKKPHNVVAFDRDHQSHVRDIDWDMMAQRNVLNKATALFEALGWTSEIQQLGGVSVPDEEVAVDA